MDLPRMEWQDRIRQAIRVSGDGNRPQACGGDQVEMLTEECLGRRGGRVSNNSKPKQKLSYSGAGTSGWTLTFSEYQAQESRD